MGLLIDLKQSFLCNVCIYLRRRQVAMAEQFLHATEVGAAIEQVSGETVA
jgi:hypothetical protein